MYVLYVLHVVYVCMYVSMQCNVMYCIVCYVMFCYVMFCYVMYVCMCLYICRHITQGTYVNAEIYEIKTMQTSMQTSMQPSMQTKL